MTPDLPQEAALKAMARAKVQDVAWASGLKLEDLALRALELRAIHRFEAEKARREGRDDQVKACETQALALLDLLELFWTTQTEDIGFPSQAMVSLREADKALLQSFCLAHGVEDWLAP